MFHSRPQEEAALSQERESSRKSNVFIVLRPVRTSCLPTRFVAFT
jgi:hypothetical protein